MMLLSRAVSCSSQSCRSIQSRSARNHNYGQSPYLASKVAQVSPRTVARAAADEAADQQDSSRDSRDSTESTAGKRRRKDPDPLKRSRVHKCSVGTGDYSFEACLNTVLRFANNPNPALLFKINRSPIAYREFPQQLQQQQPQQDVQDSAGELQLSPEISSILSSSRHENEFWLWIRCGTWLEKNERGTGPAYAILQLWKVSDQLYDYNCWDIGPDNLPSGKYHNSATAFESMTNEGVKKKYIATFMVLNRADGVVRGLDSWLKRNIGWNVKLMPKGTSGRSYPPRQVDQHIKRMSKAAAREAAAAKAASAAAAVDVLWKMPRREERFLVPARRRRIAQRIEAYIGSGKFPPGEFAAMALEASESAAAAAAAAAVDTDTDTDSGAAAAEAPPEYIWPQHIPAVLPADLNMAPKQVQQRVNIVEAIKSGQEDMSLTHLPLHMLLQCTSPRPSSSSSSSGGLSRQQQQQQIYRMEDLEAVGGQAGEDAAAAAAAESMPDVQRLVAATAALAETPTDLWQAEREQQQEEQQQQQLAVVPDPTRPFTITMHNPADGLDYVVAHYEPSVRNWQRAEKAAMLCQIFHERRDGLRMSRVSARQDEMALAGMRMPRTFAGPQTHFGRYTGNEGPEADQFSLSCWPDLATAGGFRAVSSLWIDTLPGLACSLNRQATRTAVGDVAWRDMQRGKARGPPANYPIPSLYGSPFTTLAVTQNYESQLHCEPAEHPFSFIAWLDVLSSGSSMEVGYFWLTRGLAFSPLDGSALYIDVQLVPHCSDPSYVYNAQFYQEGRYGAALFIKPIVMSANTTAWAAFEQYLQSLAADFTLAETRSGDPAEASQQNSSSSGSSSSSSSSKGKGKKLALWERLQALQGLAEVLQHAQEQQELGEL